ncbi:LysR substrate-binding domain-containing protein [Salipiger marinus]|jgi:LysR family transcriptional regulator, hydrogen peroxide-inducible genes activator|uniref:LysR substrate-binding domain-containing protein n=1 Tax=Salipiger marinus TaxID=555512 RepID=UPI000E86D0F2|nr:LysR substrate-binding domain-containing protein [Salipiger manganoxidans]MCD1616920.1 LysR family transcriptional regulator [Salipiger manganoxidans]MEB3419973.1 LysR substrate-binding domain-containing protein [Salipiger manganoxidans]HBM58417.1 LysR family transcriptional regulator [Citreicella sp.]HBT03077.1 LysR family transcriptional regulator [Citreicella sp.]
MNMTLRQLGYFKALSEQRNFRRAAEACHVSQPALSVQIRELETTLNGPLVERHARDVVLTPFGREVLEVADRILGEVAALEQAARRRGGLTGRLALGVIPTIAPYFLPEALAAMRAADISLDVSVTEAVTDRLLDQLLDGRLDAAVIALPAEREGIAAEPLFEDRFLLAGSAARLELYNDVPHPEGLGESQLLLLEDGHCLTDQALAVCGRSRGNARINMGASSLATLSRLVAAGFGLTLMPEIAIPTEARAAEGMCLRRFATPEPSRSIGLVRRASTPAQGWFTDLAQRLRGVGEDLTARSRASVPAY